MQNIYPWHVNNIIRHKSRCSNVTCRGFAKHTGITYQNLKIPSFLFLNFLVEGTGNNLFNNFKDSCVLEQTLKLGRHQLELLCGLMASQGHFFSISKILGFFYKFDNMIQEKLTKGFDTFREAYVSKSDVSSKGPFCLSRKCVRPWKGAIYFVVYKGPERNESEEEYWMKRLQFSKSLNNLPNLTLESYMENSTKGQLPTKKPRLDLGKPDADSDLFVNKPAESLSPVHQDFESMPEDLFNLYDENNNKSQAETDDDTFMNKNSFENDGEMTENVTDSIAEEDVSSESNDEEDIGSECDDIEETFNDVTETESHNSKCSIDYRLQTFQDIGRYMQNNPGSFYDHSTNLWFCSICQHFAGNQGKSRSWVDVGVCLGTNPGRALKRHFLSEFHKKNLELKHLFGKVKSKEKPSQLLNMLKNFTTLSEKNQMAENREVFKILFRTAHYIIKKMMSNLTYSSLVQLISDCGSKALQKFILKSPKNATYLSSKTFNNILNVLNSFTEDTLLESLKAAEFVTIFHDETTDISNHS